MTVSFYRLVWNKYRKRSREQIISSVPFKIMKKKDLYLDSGYLNWKTIFNLKYHFIYVIGGRGIGKTYGALEKAYEDNIKFLFMRRTQIQADTICSLEFNPFKKLNEDKGWHIYPKKITKYTYGFYEGCVEDDKIEVDTSAKIADGIALSTFSNIRGFDASDLDLILFDEYIKQMNERAMRGEADAYFNVLETVIRNKAINGGSHPKVICLSNSTDVSNPIFLELGIVTPLMKLSKKGEFIYENPERDMCVIMPKDSPISEAKKETPLYKHTKGTTFYQSSIDNEFVYNSFTNVKSRPLNEYKGIVHAGEITIYKHKSNGHIYISEHKAGVMPCYGSTFKELSIFRRKYSYLLSYMYAGKIEYETFTAEVLFDKYFNPY